MGNTAVKIHSHTKTGVHKFLRTSAVVRILTLKLAWTPFTRFLHEEASQDVISGEYCFRDHSHRGIHKLYSSSTAVKGSFEVFPDTPPGFVKLHMTYITEHCCQYPCSYSNRSGQVSKDLHSGEPLYARTSTVVKTALSRSVSGLLNWLARDWQDPHSAEHCFPDPSWFSNWHKQPWQL